MHGVPDQAGWKVLCNGWIVDLIGALAQFVPSTVFVVKFQFHIFQKVFSKQWL